MKQALILNILRTLRLSVFSAKGRGHLAHSLRAGCPCSRNRKLDRSEYKGRLAFSKTLLKPAVIALLLMPFAFQPAYAVLEGALESVSCDEAKGWAYDNAAPGVRINVNVYKVIKQKSTLLATLKADTYRQDLFDNGKGDGKVGFAFRLPASVRNATTLTLSLRYAGTATDLAQSPQTTTSACYDRLNDTGWLTCANATDQSLKCPMTGYLGQDGDYGRDAKARAKTLVKSGQGPAGFDYTKIANDGSELLPTAVLGSGAKNWACTLDNLTGKMWEIKGNDGGLRDKDNSYTWYNPNNTTNGGDPGTQNGGVCTGGIFCDTEAYVKAVNAAKLCGKSDWRLPDYDSLLSLIDYSQSQGTVYDANFFPNTNDDDVWTSLPYANSTNGAWVVSFYDGIGNYSGKNNRNAIRLVRGKK